jgi:5' nucleotidase, deoxy (Pyrimidine), cytosolic type C protein (NT5C)
MKKIIALDADGVLLDYNFAYAKAWERVFGEFPKEHNPLAYWPYDRYAVSWLEGGDLARFQAAFDEDFWSNLTALPDALHACSRLVSAGYELVCISALPLRFQEARWQNLQQLRLPITRLYTTPRMEEHLSATNTKAAVINELQPAAFVDDYLPFLLGVNSSVHRALVLREPVGSPNHGDGLLQISSSHKNLDEFASWWLDHFA